MTPVYLAGPILGCDDIEALDWREEAKRELVGVETLDPMRRDFRGYESVRVAEIVESDKADIKASGAVLAMCSRPSAGTSMEILYAWRLGVPVVSVVPAGVPVSPWIAYHSVAVVETLREACRAVRRHAV